MTPALVVADPDRLAQLEAVIASGMQTFLAVGNALLEIQTGKLYRLSGYPTFEDYTRDRWGLSRQRAYQLSTAAKVAKSLPMSTAVDTTERALRVVAKVAPDQRAEVWTRAERAAGGGRVQQRHVEAAVAQAIPASAMPDGDRQRLQRLDPQHLDALVDAADLVSRAARVGGDRVPAMAEAVLVLIDVVARLRAAA